MAFISYSSDLNTQTHIASGSGEDHSSNTVNQAVAHQPTKEIKKNNRKLGGRVTGAMNVLRQEFAEMQKKYERERAALSPLAQFVYKLPDNNKVNAKYMEGITKKIQGNPDIERTAKKSELLGYGDLLKKLNNRNEPNLLLALYFHSSSTIILSNLIELIKKMFQKLHW